MNKISVGSHVRIINKQSDFSGEKGTVEALFEDGMIMIKLDKSIFGITAFTFEDEVEVIP